MNTNPRRSKEVDPVLKEMEKRDKKVEAPVSENRRPNRAAQDSWQGASISAYRSAYLKLHRDDL